MPMSLPPSADMTLFLPHPSDHGPGDLALIYLRIFYSKEWSSVYSTSIAHSTYQSCSSSRATSLSGILIST